MLIHFYLYNTIFCWNIKSLIIFVHLIDNIYRLKTCLRKNNLQPRFHNLLSSFIPSFKYFKIIFAKKKINNLSNDNWKKFKENSVNSSWEIFEESRVVFVHNFTHTYITCIFFWNYLELDRNGKIEQNEWNFDDCLIDIEVIYWFRCFIYCFRQYLVSFTVLISMIQFLRENN